MLAHQVRANRKAAAHIQWFGERLLCLAAHTPVLLAVQEACVLGQVWELPLTVMQQVLQLTDTQQPILVPVCYLKKLIYVLGREGVVDGGRVTKHKDAAVAALHAHELVGQHTPAGKRAGKTKTTLKKGLPYEGERSGLLRRACGG